MIRDITIGQYVPGSSLLHKSDPRTKLILTFVMMIFIFMIDTYWGYLTLAIFTAITVITSGIPVKFVLKGLKPIVFIVVFAAVINTFTISGTPIFELGFLKPTYEGLNVAVKMAIRLFLLIIMASLLTYTTTPISLTDGIEKLLNPLKRIKVPVHEISMMMTIALRFIPTLLEETDKIIKAQSSRGADFENGNLIARAKSFIPVLIPLFISAFRRADELATAMEARCYRGSEGRTRMKQLNFTKNDVIIAAITIAFMAWVLVMQNVSK
ncbi:energy-coupling factor transporter transmembrane component T family protein [Ruminiclostridium sufflavum]|nr:energy-coupling factor transporter transmembrane component T [Ruminiclostridium sufflavum]